eukprot:COSAG01_NODE_2898_length_6893_cov_45.927878_10_plen_243_part_00
MCVVVSVRKQHSKCDRIHTVYLTTLATPRAVFVDGAGAAGALARWRASMSDSDDSDTGPRRSTRVAHRALSSSSSSSDEEEPLVRISLADEARIRKRAREAGGGLQGARGARLSTDALLRQKQAGDRAAERRRLELEALAGGAAAGSEAGEAGGDVGGEVAAGCGSAAETQLAEQTKTLVRGWEEDGAEDEEPLEAFGAWDPSLWQRVHDFVPTIPRAYASGDGGPACERGRRSQLMVFAHP